MRKHLLVTLLFIILGTGFSQAQNIGAGQWRMHLPFNDPVGINFSDSYVYSWTRYGFFRYNRQSSEIEILSKINGFTDFNVSTLKYNPDFKVMFIAYANSNIDLLWDNQTVENVPDILQSAVPGSKQINNIYFDGDYAFLSCGFGIHVYNLRKKESSTTYYDAAYTNVNDITILNGRIYAARDNGIYSAPMPSVGIFITPDKWQLEKAGYARFINHEGGKIYSVTDSTLFSFDGNTWQQVAQKDDYRSMVSAGNKLFVTCDSGYFMYENGQPSFKVLEGSRYSIHDENGQLWYASQGYGMIHVNATGNPEFIFPAGPYANVSGKMVSKGNVLWVAGGLMKEFGGATYSSNGFYKFEDGNWTNSISQNIPVVNGIKDIHALALDPNSDDIWMAGLLQGVFRLRDKQVLAFYDESNSPIRLTNPENITALAFDNKKNLWVGNFVSPTPLLVKTPAGQWDSFSLGSASQKVLDIVVDKANNKWIRVYGSIGGNSGIVVYSDNNTPLDKSDDPAPKILSTVTGSGKLPDNQVNCMAVDRNGQIWVGTAKGLTVFYSPGNILSSAPSDARQIVLGEGGVLGYLLGEESITAILVDGGNRKWIAARSGLWLVSPDGQEVLAYFNEGNSPLLSNNISQLGMVEETGELFIATDKGMISYRTSSSVAGDKHTDVKVFPNPVRPDYEGPINISGLPQDAYVKITDIAGNLIYETQANGGTASWNGRNFDGRRAATGVYLVFSGNKDASDTFVSKILFIGR